MLRAWSSSIRRQSRATDTRFRLIVSLATRYCGSVAWVYSDSPVAKSAFPCPDGPFRLVRRVVWRSMVRFDIPECDPAAIAALRARLGVSEALAQVLVR